MRLKIKIITITLIVAMPVVLPGVSELPMHQKRLSERAFVVRTCNYIQTTAVIALATSKGIVVIETRLSRTNGTKIRQVIKNAFGRDPLGEVFITSPGGSRR